MSEENLITAAAGGDERAFAELLEPHRRVLHAHCYRMLGSVQDAEDALQETLLRAWRSLGAFQGRSSFRTWLYTVATNACLRAIERRPQRLAVPDFGPPADPRAAIAAPLVESTWIQPYPDAEFDPGDGLAGPEARYEQREAVELAFIAALQHLPARQRAVLILRDVLGFTGAETAEALATTPASVYSALQRAHEAVDSRLPERSQQATLRALGDRELNALVGRYVTAWEANDVDAIATMLTDDAVLAMPPTPAWFRGRADMIAVLETFPLSGAYRWDVTPVRVNAQLAVVVRRADALAGAVAPHHLAVLTLRGGLISEMTAFLE